MLFFVFKGKGKFLLGAHFWGFSLLHPDNDPMGADGQVQKYEKLCMF